MKEKKLKNLLLLCPSSVNGITWRIRRGEKWMETQKRRTKVKWLLEGGVKWSWRNYMKDKKKKKWNGLREEKDNVKVIAWRWNEIEMDLVGYTPPPISTFRLLPMYRNYALIWGATPNIPPLHTILHRLTERKWQNGQVKPLPNKTRLSP